LLHQRRLDVRGWSPSDVPMLLLHQKLLQLAPQQ
jgi:hypothetical protein